MKFLDDKGVKTIANNVKKRLATKADLQEGNIPVEQLGNIQNISNSVVDDLWGDSSDISTTKKRKRERRIIFRKSISMYSTDDNRYEYAYVSSYPGIRIPTSVSKNFIKIYLNNDIYKGAIFCGIGYDIKKREDGSFLFSRIDNTRQVCNVIKIDYNIIRHIYIVDKYDLTGDTLSIYIRRIDYQGEPSYNGRIVVGSPDGVLRCTDVPNPSIDENGYVINRYCNFYALSRQHYSRNKRKHRGTTVKNHRWKWGMVHNVRPWHQIKIQPIYKNKNIKGNLFKYQLRKGYSNTQESIINVDIHTI